MTGEEKEKRSRRKKERERDACESEIPWELHGRVEGLGAGTLKRNGRIQNRVGVMHSGASTFEHRPCVFPVKDDSQALIQVVQHKILGLACQSRLSFGKLSKDLGSRWAPSAPVCFNHHRGESKAFGGAQRLSVEVAPLETLV